MGSSTHTQFEVGAWRVEPDLCRITCEGKEIVLQPRWMDLLVYLAENAGDVVSTDDIMENVWGGVEVTQDSVYFTVSHLRKELAEDPTHPVYIETIAKRGYRLIAPVVFPEPQEALKTAARNRWMTGTAIVAVLALAFTTSLFLREEDQPPPNPDSIAILPFVDLNPIGDDSFAVGFADDLIIKLNTIDGIEIMARTSSFSLNARQATAQEIGEQLGVATVLEGSVRRQGDKIQVTAQLVKTADGFHIWADTYQYDIGAISRIQSDIARQVAEGLGLFMPPAYLATLDPTDVPIVLQTRVNTYTENNQERPGTIALADGGYIIYWRSMDQDGSNWGAYAQKFNAGGAADGAEFRLHTTTIETQYQAHLSAHTDGGFVATWTSWEADGSHWGTLGRRFNGKPEATSNEFVINDYTLEVQAQSSVAVDPHGRMFFIYSSRGQDGSHFGMFGRWFDASGQPLGKSFQINSFGPADQGRAKLVALEPAGMMAIWNSYGQDGSGFGVFGRYIDATGNASGPEIAVNSFTNGDQEFPEIAALSGGGAVVVWQSRGQDHGGEGGAGAFGQRFDATGARLGEEFAINSTTAHDQQAPQITVTKDGGFFVTWMSENQAALGMDIFGQRFNSQGHPVGEELFVNVVTNSYQRYPSAVSLLDGSVVVAFQADDWDGSYFGIFRRRLVFAGISGGSMDGKVGADTFVFEASFDHIEIADFNADIDRFDLSALDTDFDSLSFVAERNSVMVDTGHGVIVVDGAQQLIAGHFLF